MPAGKKELCRSPPTLHLLARFQNSASLRPKYGTNRRPQHTTKRSHNTLHTHLTVSRSVLVHSAMAR